VCVCVCVGGDGPCAHHEAGEIVN